MVNLLPQKVKHFYKELEKKNPDIAHNYMGTIKKDGWYSFIDFSVDSGWGLVSNENRIIPSFTEASTMFKSLPTPKTAGRLIMEAYIPKTPFHILNGIFNRKSEQAKDVHFVIHDWVPEDYYKNISENTAINRYNRLQSLGLRDYFSEDRLTIMPLFGISSDQKDWFSWFDQSISLEEEGIILKKSDSLYQPDKRNSSLMKIKCEEEADLLATNFFKSIGEKGNDAWNLTLKDSSGITLTVRVGKDSDIINFLAESPVGKIHQIKYMKKLENGSYREPVYVGPRYDKKESD